MMYALEHSPDNKWLWKVTDDGLIHHRFGLWSWESIEENHHITYKRTWDILTEEEAMLEML